MNDERPASLYTNDFFAPFIVGAGKSASTIFGVLREYYQPASVVDVGCGQGAWVAALRAAGVARVVGIDGDYVNTQELLFPVEDFLAMDLADPKPVSERFDLAYSMEVAEHLPTKASRDFVKFLTSLAPVVLFSAAVPGQAGVGHINAQWPGFWEGLFRECGYSAIDAIRPRIWHDETVYLHYRQNALVFVDDRALNLDPQLSGLKPAPPANCLTLVDEDILMQQLGLRASLQRIPRLCRAWLSRKLHRAGR
jgi:SAM-dependent methyltransferase